MRFDVRRIEVTDLGDWRKERESLGFPDRGERRSNAEIPDEVGVVSGDGYTDPIEVYKTPPEESRQYSG